MDFFKIADIIYKIYFSEYDDIDFKDIIKLLFDEKILMFIDSETIKNFDYDIKILKGGTYVESGECINELPYYRIYKTSNGFFRYVFLQRSSKFVEFQCTATIDIPLDWSYAVITDYIGVDERIKNKKYLSLFFVLRQYLLGTLLQHNSTFIHGVSLVYNDIGIIFSGNSGVGKTTHTNMWKKYYNADILNGDSPIVKIIDNKPFIYGSPWCGASNITQNKTFPLSLLISLKHGENNKLNKLTKKEAFDFLMTQISRPFNDQSSFLSSIDICDKLIKNINIFEYECVPDISAVKTLVDNIDNLKK